jgi:hypothetical protein
LMRVTHHFSGGLASTGRSRPEEDDKMFACFRPMRLHERNW